MIIAFLPYKTQHWLATRLHLSPTSYTHCSEEGSGHAATNELSPQQKIGSNYVTCSAAIAVLILVAVVAQQLSTAPSELEDSQEPSQEVDVRVVSLLSWLKSA